MCGIVCYVGGKQARPILMDGLKQLEYRGYDSSGIAIQHNNQIHRFRAVGRILELEKKINSLSLSGTVGMAHTRWATHGEPSEINAHPHTDQEQKVFIVHNGIIENYHQLKKRLEKRGVKFSSETDTEVMAHLIAYYFEGDLGEAVRRTMGDVEGTFGIAVLHRDVPGQIVVARRGSP
ncbi:MAG TPA: glutamine--fructose-6-phosphate aminotransferase, partial [Desulfobacterales bacterium]|nr:glutamine--fructose-6-phosphate aminotransferase [Desulfobacterales bacterium]